MKIELKIKDVVQNFDVFEIIEEIIRVHGVRRVLRLVLRECRWRAGCVLIDSDEYVKHCNRKANEIR